MNQNDPTQKRLELINAGKQSGIILDLLGDKIRGFSQKHLEAMKASYRAGKTDQSTLLSHVAAITCLDDLYAELARDVKTGNSASKDIHGTKNRTDSDNEQFPIA